MTNVLNEGKAFVFDFEISEQAKDWQELDVQAPAHDEEKHQCQAKSFFSNSSAGGEYFKIDQSAAVKKKWIEDRRLVKDSVRRTGKQFLLDIIRKH